MPSKQPKYLQSRLIDDLNPFSAQNAIYDQSSLKVSKWKNAFMGLLYFAMLMTFIMNELYKVYQNDKYPDLTDVTQTKSLDSELIMNEGDIEVMIYFAAFNQQIHRFDYDTHISKYIKAVMAPVRGDKLQALKEVDCDTTVTYSNLKNDKRQNLSDTEIASILTQSICYTYTQGVKIFRDDWQNFDIVAKDPTSKTHLDGVIDSYNKDMKSLKIVTVTMKVFFDGGLKQKIQSYAQTISFDNAYDTFVQWTLYDLSEQYNFFHPDVDTKVREFHDYENTYNVQAGTRDYYARYYIRPTAKYFERTRTAVSIYSLFATIGGILTSCLAITALTKQLLFGTPIPYQKYFLQFQVINKVDSDYKKKENETLITLNNEVYVVINPEQKEIQNIKELAKMFIGFFRNSLLLFPYNMIKSLYNWRTADIYEKLRMKTLIYFKDDYGADATIRSDYVEITNKLKCHEFALQALLGDDLFAITSEYRSKFIYEAKKDLQQEKQDGKQIELTEVKLEDGGVKKRKNSGSFWNPFRNNSRKTSIDSQIDNNLQQAKPTISAKEEYYKLMQEDIKEDELDQELSKNIQQLVRIRYKRKLKEEFKAIQQI